MKINKYNAKMSKTMNKRLNYYSQRLSYIIQTDEQSLMFQFVSPYHAMCSQNKAFNNGVFRTQPFFEDFHQGLLGYSPSTELFYIMSILPDSQRKIEMI